MQGCDLVIALTHCRWPNDMRLANECDPDLIDLILGGHDHDYGVRPVERRTADGRIRKLTAIKSGADFRDFNVLTVRVDEAEIPSGCFAKLSETDQQDGGSSFTHCGVTRRKFISDLQVERVPVTSKFPPDPEMAAEVHSYVAQREKELNVVLGEIDVELDARFSEVRTRETNAGNFVADIMLQALEAQVAILNGGNFHFTLISSLQHQV